MYYLACGEHPAWGYGDQPPLIARMALLLEHTIGVSLLRDAVSSSMLGDLGLHRNDRSAGARKLGGGFWAMLLSSLAVLVAADLPVVFPAIHHGGECLRSAPVDIDCMVSCRSCPNRQGTKLAMDRSLDRYYAAEQIRRTVFPCWPYRRRCVFAATPQFCTTLVLDRMRHCHSGFAAEFSLAASPAVSLRSTGKQRSKKWGDVMLALSCRIWR